MSTASHSEPAQAGSQPADGLPLTAAVQKRMPLACGLCLKGVATAGRYWWRLGLVCGECNGFLQEVVSVQPPELVAQVPKVTHCPAKGLAAGWDPRTQLPPDARIVGFFTRDWLAKRAAA